jgi:hypothetical protein
MMAAARVSDCLERTILPALYHRVAACAFDSPGPPVGLPRKIIGAGPAGASPLPAGPRLYKAFCFAPFNLKPSRIAFRSIANRPDSEPALCASLASKARHPISGHLELHFVRLPTVRIHNADCVHPRLLLLFLGFQHCAVELRPDLDAVDVDRAFT